MFTLSRTHFQGDFSFAPRGRTTSGSTDAGSRDTDESQQLTAFEIAAAAGWAPSEILGPDMSSPVPDTGADVVFLTRA